MAVNTNEKLTNLGALRNLAERIEAGFATKAEVSAVSGKVDKIKVPTAVSELANDAGYQKAAEVKSAVDAAIDQFAKDVTDNDTVDTFKELVDYAAKHKGEAASMAADILQSQNDIDALEALVGDESVAKQIADAIEAEGAVKSVTHSETNGNVTVDGSEVVVYTHPTSKAGAKTAGFYKITTDATGHVTAATAVTAEDITKLGIPAQDTTYDDATQSVHGLMSTDDKTKLDGMEVASEDEVGAMLTEVFG
ncbi:MAG: hypothetical protein J1F63_00475 [Oscillospiraceae bacterium]|nr:hypothetical protein [Oscillospiraceae bacterium]